jgi:hypothetical protein
MPNRLILGDSSLFPLFTENDIVFSNEPAKGKWIYVNPSNGEDIAMACHKALSLYDDNSELIILPSKNLHFGYGDNVLDFFTAVDRFRSDFCFFAVLANKLKSLFPITKSYVAASPRFNSTYHEAQRMFYQEFTGIQSVKSIS